MTNAARTTENKRKHDLKENHKASHNLRKLKRNRRGVWVVKRSDNM